MLVFYIEFMVSDIDAINEKKLMLAFWAMWASVWWHKVPVLIWQLNLHKLSNSYKKDANLTKYVNPSLALWVFRNDQ